MSMSRKHYVLLAETIHWSMDMEQLVDNLCIVLKQDNSDFNADRFREACGAHHSRQREDNKS
jgi:hypothetical protein